MSSPGLPVFWTYCSHTIFSSSYTSKINILHQVLCKYWQRSIMQTTSTLRMWFLIIMLLPKPSGWGTLDLLFVQPFKSEEYEINLVFKIPSIWKSSRVYRILAMRHSTVLLLKFIAKAISHKKTPINKVSALTRIVLFDQMWQKSENKVQCHPQYGSVMWKMQRKKEKKRVRTDQNSLTEINLFYKSKDKVAGALTWDVEHGHLGLLFSFCMK